jgi:P27 family predicted phage terminase small subunit
MQQLASRMTSALRAMAKGRPVDPTRARRGTGNRPKPGEAKKVKQAIVLPEQLVAAVPERYPPPETLPEQVHNLWRSIVSDLGGSNHMRESFLPSITAYCEAAYLHAQASRAVHDGLVVRSPSGQVVANPAIKIQKDAAATMLRYAESLGLTPAGRIRLGLMEVTGMSLLASLNQSLDGKRG